MVRYQQADEVAATQLVRLVSPRLFRYLSARVLGRAQAEDLLQDCWLRIHSARHTYRRGEPLLPWLFAIAHHTWVDGVRRYQRVQSHETELDEAREAVRPGQPPPQAGSILVDELLNQLPEGQREVVYLLKIAGLSLEEVARATSSSVGAVKQKAHRAYAKLRKLLVETPRGSVE